MILASVFGTCSAASTRPSGEPELAPLAASVDPAQLCRRYDGWQQRRGEEVLASLGSSDSSGYRVVFAPQRPRYFGMTRPSARRVEIYVRPCEQQPRELLRHVVAHELGHAYDAVHMTGDERRAWLRARGVPSHTDWYSCAGCSDFGTPACDFAEVYAQWLRRSTTNRSTLAPAPAPAELQMLADRFFSR